MTSVMSLSISASATKAMHAVLQGTGRRLSSHVDRPERSSPLAVVSRNRNYRIFVVSQGISITGSWMQGAAQDWLILRITGSPTSLGIALACQFVPYIVIGPWAGVAADRHQKRQLLMVTQATLAILALVLTILALHDHLNVLHIYLLTLALGIVTALESPAREAFTAEMVGKDDLGGAISLNSAVFQSARIVGPTIAGLLLTVIQPGWIFAINTVSYVVVLSALMRMDRRELTATAPPPRKTVSLRSRLSYVAARPDLRYPLVLMGFMSIFGFNYPPILAGLTTDYYHRGPGVYGALNTVIAIGCLAASFIVTYFSRIHRMQMIVWAAALTAVAR